jgi:HEAT repeat protein
VKAAQHKDAAAVPDLVRMLDSDDPATRLLAIDALERITGDRKGFEPSAPEYERRKATDRWQQYVEQSRQSGRSSSQLPVPSRSNSSGEVT